MQWPSRLVHAGVALVLVTATVSCGTSSGTADQETTSTSPDSQSASTSSAPQTSTTSAASTTTTRSSPDRILRVATSEPENPPFTMINDDHIDGFEPALLEAIAAEMDGNVGFDWVIVGRGDAFGGLGDTHDIFVDRMVNNVVRQDLNAMTDPYFLAGWTAVVADASPIVTFADLTSIAVQEGTSTGIIMSELIAGAGADIELVITSDISATIASGAADGFAASSENTFEGYRTLEPPRFDLPLSMVVADPTVRDQINDALNTIIADGTWASIYEEWIGGSPLFDPSKMIEVPPTD